MEREDEYEEMVRHRLQVTVYGMEGMGSEGGWNCERYFIRDGQSRE
jgi:hypothetical protein